MLGLPKHVKIFVASQACDMRKQVDGLAGLVRQGMEREPQSGDLFVFHNRRRDVCPRRRPSRRATARDVNAVS